MDIPLFGPSKWFFPSPCLLCGLICCAIFSTTSVVMAAPPATTDFSRWEQEIARLEQRDAQQEAPHQGILFVGSSSIKRWDLPRDFPDLPVVNHGFGGSQMADSVHFADRIILPLEPRIVVVYAGDNDLAAGKTPQQVRDDFRDLVAKIHGKLPETRIVFLAIKPSLKRWNLVDRMRAANRLIREEIGSDPRLAYADIFTPMLGEDGEPRETLFVEDGLHLSRAGYALWARQLRPLLQASGAKATGRE